MTGIALLLGLIYGVTGLSILKLGAIRPRYSYLNQPANIPIFGKTTHYVGCMMLLAATSFSILGLLGLVFLWQPWMQTLLRWGLYGWVVLHLAAYPLGYWFRIRK